MLRSEPIFAFDASSHLTVFESLDLARRAVEAGTLTAPHTGIYTASGLPVRLRGQDLVVGDEPKLFDLQRRLAEYQRHLPVVPEAVDVLAFADVWLANKRG